MGEVYDFFLNSYSDYSRVDIILEFLAFWFGIISGAKVKVGRMAAVLPSQVRILTIIGSACGSITSAMPRGRRDGRIMPWPVRGRSSVGVKVWHKE